MLVTLPSSKVLLHCETTLQKLETERQLFVADHVERHNTAQMRRLLVRAGLAQPRLIVDKQVATLPFDRWHTESWNNLCDRATMLGNIRDLANLGSEIHLTEKEVALLAL